MLAHTLPGSGDLQGSALCHLSKFGQPTPGMSRDPDPCEEAGGLALRVPRPHLWCALYVQKRPDNCQAVMGSVKRAVWVCSRCVAQPAAGRSAGAGSAYV